MLLPSRRSIMPSAPPGLACPEEHGEGSTALPATMLESFGLFTRSPGFKFFLVLFLVLLMISLGLIWFLVTERETRATTVKQEVGERWGRDQHVSGPFLIVQYSVKVVIAQGESRVEQMQERRAVALCRLCPVQRGKGADHALRLSYSLWVAISHPAA
jgi:Inner membrane protein CreD